MASAATDASYETHRTRRREHGTVTLASRDRHSRTAVLDIKHSLRWHDPGRFNGYVLSQHFAGTPVDPVNLRDALRAVKERAAGPALGALQFLALLLPRRLPERPPYSETCREVLVKFPLASIPTSRVHRMSVHAHALS